MKKRVLSIFAALTAFAVITGCSSGSSGEESSETTQAAAGTEAETVSGTTDEASEDSSGAAYIPGTYTGTATGFEGEVSVTITVDASSITAVSVSGPDETPDVGGAALGELGERILSSQSSDIDVVAGATFTSTGVKDAAAMAIAQARGEETVTPAASDVKMEPGTYSSEAYGFFTGWSDKLKVTVDETSIVSIEWDPDVTSGDTPPMREAVEAQLFPRIIENQSVSVDGVTGATATSGAVKAAVSDAVTQALIAAGSDTSMLSAFKVMPEKTGGEETIETDLLVVGLGGSGTYSALRAAEQGIDVLAIEKQGRVGGTTALTSEIGVINPPRVQELYNNGEDFTDADAMKAAWLEYVEGNAKEEFIDLYVEQSGKAFDWLALDHNIQFDFVPQSGFTEADWYKIKFQWYPNTKEGETRVFGANKAEIADDFESLMDDYTAAGGEYMLETEAYEIIFEDGAVKGVKARNNIDGTEYTINAKAVILATGGYLGSEELSLKYLKNDYYPLNGVWKLYGSAGNTGLMIESAIENGAGTYNISIPPEVHMSGSAEVIPPSAGYEIHETEGVLGNFTGVQQVWSVADLPTYLGISGNSLAVDKNGSRFTAETGVAMLDPWIAGPNFYSIWSADQLNDIAENGFKYNMDGVASGFLGYCGAIPENTPLPETFDVLETGIDMGFIYKADTIEELAEAFGADPETLAATVAAYNGFCEAGEDTGFGKDPIYLEAIGEGPYYAVKMASYSYGSVGALDIDLNFQVLDTDGTPIPGLFAVGNDSAGVLFSETKPYVTYGGIDNGWALTSGYICGTKVADYINGTNDAAEILGSEVLAADGGFSKE